MLGRCDALEELHVDDNLHCSHSPVRQPAALSCMFTIVSEAFHQVELADHVPRFAM